MTAWGEDKTEAARAAAAESSYTFFTLVPILLERAYRALALACAQDGFPQITLRQSLLLISLQRNRTMTLKDLAASISRSPSSTSILVQRLVLKGFVIRIDDKADRRKSAIRLSSTGLQLVEAVQRFFLDTASGEPSPKDAQRGGQRKT